MRRDRRSWVGGCDKMVLMFRGTCLGPIKTTLAICSSRSPSKVQRDYRRLGIFVCWSIHYFIGGDWRNTRNPSSQGPIRSNLSSSVRSTGVVFSILIGFDSNYVPRESSVSSEPDLVKTMSGVIWQLIRVCFSPESMAVPHGGGTCKLPKSHLKLLQLIRISLSERIDLESGHLSSTSIAPILLL